MGTGLARQHQWSLPTGQVRNHQWRTRTGQVNRFNLRQSTCCLSAVDNVVDGRHQAAMSCLTSYKIDEACDFIWSVALIFINNHLATVILLVIITINNNATGRKCSRTRRASVIVSTVTLKCHFAIVHLFVHLLFTAFAANSLFYCIWPAWQRALASGTKHGLQDAICCYCWRVDTM